MCSPRWYLSSSDWPEFMVSYFNKENILHKDSTISVEVGGISLCHPEIQVPVELPKLCCLWCLPSGEHGNDSKKQRQSALNKLVWEWHSGEEIEGLWLVSMIADSDSKCILSMLVFEENMIQILATRKMITFPWSPVFSHTKFFRNKT